MYNRFSRQEESIIDGIEKYKHFFLLISYFKKCLKGNLVFPVHKRFLRVFAYYQNSFSLLKIMYFLSVFEDES